MGAPAARDDRVEFSLVHGDILYRVQRAVGLIPAHGLGVVRRVVLAVLVTWVPLVIAAALSHRLWPGVVDEPLLQHFGVHVRFLLAVPLFIVDDAVAERVFAEVMPYFVRSGLVTAADRPRFVEIVRRGKAWQHGWMPWIVIAGIVIAWTAASPALWDAHELNWATSNPPLPAVLHLGLLWYQYVAHPIFVVLVLAWLWRLILATVLLGRVARLDLALVPTHPDEAAGLEFLEVVPLAFAAPAFAISAVLGARWAHDAAYHSASLESFVVPLVAFVLFASLGVLVPLLAFARTLWAVRRQALFDYGTLVGEHHRRLRRRWILGEALEGDPMLEAPELGAGAYSGRLYDAVWGMWPIPISKRNLLAVVVLIAAPMLPLVAFEVHLGDAVMKILKTLL